MKRILASILAVVLLATMAVSAFADAEDEAAADEVTETEAVVEETEAEEDAEAEEEAEEAILSGTAQTGTNDEGTVAQVTTDGTATVTVSAEDAEDGSVELPITLWVNSTIVVSLPEDAEIDIIDLQVPLTNVSLCKGVVLTYIDDETGDNVILDNVFDENGNMVVYNVPADVELTLKNLSVDFADVEDADWFKEEIHYASAHGYLVGYTNEDGELVVDPEGEITDAALYSVLLRVIGEGETTYGDDWADNARARAAELEFAIEDAEGALTRAQAIEIATNFLGEDAVEAGIFVGDENGDLNAEEAFNRAQLATISERLVKAINE